MTDKKNMDKKTIKTAVANAPNVLAFKRPKASEKHKGKTLCREGFHKWKVVTNSKFDTKQGKLVTVYECARCGKQKVKAH